MSNEHRNEDRGASLERGADKSAAEEKIKQIRAAYDRTSQEAHDAGLRATEAEAQVRQLRETLKTALQAIDAFWPSDPPENEGQASEDRAIAKVRKIGRAALAATEPDGEFTVKVDR